jgi:hypothetical protein
VNEISAAVDNDKSVDEVVNAAPDDDGGADPLTPEVSDDEGGVEEDNDSSAKSVTPRNARRRLGVSSLKSPLTSTGRGDVRTLPASQRRRPLRARRARK